MADDFCWLIPNTISRRIWSSREELRSRIMTLVVSIFCFNSIDKQTILGAQCSFSIHHSYNFFCYSTHKYSDLWSSMPRQSSKFSDSHKQSDLGALETRGLNTLKMLFMAFFKEKNIHKNCSLVKNGRFINI